jgi:hypothetical protein
MAKQKQQAAAAGDETPPVDTAEAATEAVAEILEVADAPAKFSAMAALEGSSGDLHAIYMRFAEMLPLLPGAIEQAEGDVKDFLSGLSHYL